MSFSEKIKLLFDVDTTSASKNIKGLRSDINDADGAFGKAKAGASGLGAMIKENLGVAAVAAGAALVTFGVKAAGAFQQVALEAGKFGDATGIAVDDASRWIEVAGDMGIEAGAIEGSILKFNKALADGKPAIENYGIEVVKTKDGVIDANATFQNAITKIGAIEDPTKRAQAAQELFGKSYKSVAEIMEMSAGDLEAALQGVSEQKVIDQGELDRAREFRGRMDQLKDVWEDFTLSVGELVVQMGPALTLLANTATAAAGLAGSAAEAAFGTGEMSSAYKDFAKAVEEGTPEEAIRDLYNATVEADGGLKALGAAAGVVFKGDDEGTVRWERLVKVFKELSTTSPELAAEMYDALGIIVGSADAGYDSSVKLADQIGLTSERFKELKAPVEGAAEAIDAVAGAVDNTTGPMASANEMLGRYEKAGKEAADAAKELADSQAVLEAAIKKADDALQVMKGHIDDRQAWRNMQEAIEELRVKMADGEASWNDLADASDDVALAMADVIEQAENIPAEVKTRLYQEIDAGNLDEVNKLLERWQLGYRIPLYPKVVTPSGGANPGAVIPIVGAFHDGGVVPGPMGKEQLALVKGGETVLPTHKGDVAMSSGGSTVVNLYVTSYGSSANDLGRLLQGELLRLRQRGVNI